MDMGLAAAWLALHIFGVFVALALLVIVCRKENTNYKCELVLAFSCCLVTLVAKSFYIMGGDEETLLGTGKAGISGQMFRKLLCLDVFTALEKRKGFPVVYHRTSFIKYRVLYADRNGGSPSFLLQKLLAGAIRGKSGRVYSGDRGSSDVLCLYGISAA